MEFHYRDRGRPAEKRPCVPSSPAELADLLDPPPDRKWEVKFVGRKGGPGKPYQYWREHKIRMAVWNERVQQGKLRRAKVELGGP